MNYGYAALNDDGIYLKDHIHHPWVLSMQLYHHAVLSIANIKSLKDKTLLEVGSGRGGGLNFLMKTL
jgi:hypothetical protein